MTMIIKSNLETIPIDEVAAKLKVDAKRIRAQLRLQNIWYSKIDKIYYMNKKDVAIIRLLVRF